MASCEKNILEIPLNGSAPAATDVVIFTGPTGVSVIRTWASILAAIIPSDIDFIVPAVGSTVDGVTIPGDGDTTYINPALIGRRVRVFRNHMKQTTLTITGGYKFSFNTLTGSVTLTPSVNEDELISIEPY